MVAVKSKSAQEQDWPGLFVFLFLVFQELPDGGLYGGCQGIICPASAVAVPALEGAVVGIDDDGVFYPLGGDELLGNLLRIALDKVYVVQVEEIGDFHLLVGAQHFVLDRDGLFRPCVYYLALEVLQVASHGGVVRFGDIVEERVEVVPFVWRVEIGCEEHDELVHYAFVLHHGAAEVIADDKVQPGIVYDIQLLLRGVHMDYGVSGGMECGYGAWYPQGAKQGVNVFP